MKIIKTISLLVLFLLSASANSESEELLKATAVKMPSENNLAGNISSEIPVNKTLISQTKIAEETEESEEDAKRIAHFRNIDELVILRAPGLAFKYLQREQPEYSQQQPAQWLYWEQKRIALLKYMRRWQDVNKRVSQQEKNLLSTKITAGDRNWFLTEQLRALIELKQYSLALGKTRKLMWGASALVKSKSFAAWRRIIIQIYLNQGNTNDAQSAMRRYQQDYGELLNEDGVSWLQLQAELLIQLEQYKDAIKILSKINTDESRALILIAKLNAQIISPPEVLDSVQLALASEDENVERIVLYKYVALVAAMTAGEVDQSISLLEALLSEQQLSLSDSLIQIGKVKINATTLWDYYLNKGNNVANRKGLLKGDDENWYTLASNLFQDQPLTAKSLFAVLSLQAKEVLHRELAMKQLVNLIEVNNQPLELVNRLFTESDYITDMKHVPLEVRYRLIDYSLLHGDVKAAAALMADLDKPPEDQAQFDWNLRRARVLVLSGSFKTGAEVLLEMLHMQQLDAKQIAKYLQVVFDLQAVEQHKLSLWLFDELDKLVEDVHIRRELTFWRAESYHGLKQYDLAAYLFLKSAVSPDKVFDPWYHTATFRAAESLMEAGLLEDARQRFMHLLRITENSARKAVIRQRLQTIQLKQSR